MLQKKFSFKIGYQRLFRDCRRNVNKKRGKISFDFPTFANHTLIYNTYGQKNKSGHYRLWAHGWILSDRDAEKPEMGGRLHLRC